MDVYVLQLHIIHDGTYTEGVTHSLEVANNWVAELPRDYNSDPYSQKEWRSWTRFTPEEDALDEDLTYED